MASFTSPEVASFAQMPSSQLQATTTEFGRALRALRPGVRALDMRTWRVCCGLYRFGGGFCGLGTPVVSYAPLPMLIDVSGLVIMKSGYEAVGAS